MKRKTKGKLDCKELDKGLRMNEHTLDALVTPGHYKIESCDVTTSEGFPEEISKGRLSAYLEVTSTNHSSDRLKDNAIGQVLTVTDSDGVTNIYTRNRTNINAAYIWSEWSGVGGKSAGDIMDGAITAQKLSNDIRSNVVSPLRPLFIAAGAEYNDTGADIIKTAPWGETVTHKAGYYYLNGLGDITEEQMIHIYINKELLTKLHLHRAAQANVNLRTIMPLHNKFSAGSLSASSMSVFAYCSNLEVLIWNKESSLIDGDGQNKDNVESLIPFGSSGGYNFAGCSMLRYIYPINASKTTSFVNTFLRCNSLIEARLYRIKANISFSDSPLISKECITYIIRNSVPSSAITITLHPDAYNRLKDDTDIIAALESQPLVTLVCAGD